MFMTTGAVIIQVTNGPMVAAVTGVTMVIIATKITNFPTINFATIIVKITDVDWMLWLQEGAVTLSLCAHFPFPAVIFPSSQKPSKTSPSPLFPTKLHMPFSSLPRVPHASPTLFYVI